MDLISVEEASKILHLPAYALPNLRRKGLGPVYIKLGAKVFYTKAGLDAWVVACTHEPVARVAPVAKVEGEASVEVDLG